MLSTIFKKTNLATLVRHLDLSGINRKVINHNIANVNTPGYLKKEMTFSDALSDYRKRLNVSLTQPGHRMPTDDDSVQIVESLDQTMKNGINNVDIDQEMMDLAKNQLESFFSLTMVTRLFRSFKTVIKEQAG